MSVKRGDIIGLMVGLDRNRHVDAICNRMVFSKSNGQGDGYSVQPMVRDAKQYVASGRDIRIQGSKSRGRTPAYFMAPYGVGDTDQPAAFGARIPLGKDPVDLDTAARRLTGSPNHRASSHLCTAAHPPAVQFQFVLARVSSAAKSVYF